MKPYVTISGADDGVNPFHLLELSEEFPFVEWGILFSAKRCGSPRYPSMPWIMALERVARVKPMRLSLHLCGAAARDTMLGLNCWLRATEDAPASMKPPVFQRVQLNGYAHETTAIQRLSSIASVRQIEFILQARSVAQIEQAARDVVSLSVAFVPSASVLFDPSGGRGVLSAEPWPAAPPDVKLGHAGGIGPDNVAVRYADAKRLGVSWIDMESGVRNIDPLSVHGEPDTFDLTKVRQVLETCKELQ